MKKTLLLFLLLFLLVSHVVAQDSLQVRRLSELYTYADFDNIRDLDAYSRCIVNDTGYTTLYRNLNIPFTWFPDTVHSNNVNYFAVDDSGFVYVQNHTIQERWDTDGKCFHVANSENWLYAATSTGLEKIQRDHEQSVLYELNGGGKWVANRYQYAYFVANNHFIYSFDVSSSQNISVIDSIDMGTEIEDVYYDYPLLFVALGEQGWTIINLQTSTNLVEITPPYSTVQAFDIEVYRDEFWISSETEGAYHFDIEDLNSITFIENVPIYSNDICAYPSLGKIATIQDNNSLNIYNWDDPDSIYQVDHYGKSKILDFFVFPSEDYLFQGIVLDQYNGVRRIGMDTPEATGDFPGFYDTIGRIIDGEDSLFAVQTFDNNILIFRYDYYSFGEELAITWTIPFDEELNDLDIKYDCLYTLSDESGLCIYELMVSEPPRLVFQDESITGTGMDLAPLFLGVVDEEYGLKTYSYEELETGVIDEGSIQLNSTPLDLMLYDNFAFISCGADGFKIIDCYDVENPQIASETDTDGFTYDVSMGGGYFYIADGPEGVLVYDIHNPYEPELVGYYDTPGNSFGVDAWHENCGVADSSGVYILRYAYATDAPEIKTTTPFDFRIENVYPNPFNPDCLVRINIPESGLMELKVYNVLGEEVSSLSKAKVKAGTFDYQFFGNNFASGIYFLQVELEGYGIQTRKMVLMK